MIIRAQTGSPASPSRTMARRAVPNNLMAIVLFAAMLAVGCATEPHTPAAKTVSPGMLLEARPLVGEGSAVSLPDTDVLALDPQMLVFLNQFVDTRQADYAKLRQLLQAIMNESTLGLEYNDQTHTAAETFHLQRGNCLSFTNMFVAMARHVGIDARFQEVDVPPDWAVQDGAFVLNRHVNVLVELGYPGKRVVDFNIDVFRASYDRRQVNDRRAIAHYNNNMGVERMYAGETVEAVLYFRRAIENDHNFSPPWSNLGTLYRRNGRLVYAEAAYLQALDANRGDFVAMSNLADLYGQQGDEERAARYRQRVNDHRMRNPYYRYRLAREAFIARDYDTSIGHLNYSVKKKKNEDTFYFLMGMSYLEKGDESAARQWLEKAEQVAEDDDVQRNYQSKLEMLLSTQE